MSTQKRSRLNDARGSNSDRAARKLWLLRTFGDGTLTTCFLCAVPLGYEDVTADRIRPGILGGTYKRSNLRPACQPCQTETGNEILEKFRVELQRNPGSMLVFLLSGQHGPPTPETMREYDMASINQMIKDAKRSLEIRQGRKENVDAELTNALAAQERVTKRVEAAKAAKDKNDADMVKFEKIVTALGVLDLDDESDSDDETPDAEPETSDETGDAEPETSDETGDAETTEPPAGPVRVGGRFARKS